MSTIIAELQAQNKYLKSQLSEYPEKYNANMNDNLFLSISQLTTDVTTLKAKLVCH